MDRHLRRQREGAAVPGAVGGTSQRHGTRTGGIGSRLATCLWNMRRVTERPRASPSCSAQTKPQFRFHPPGLHPQPGQRDKTSSDSHGWRIKASGIVSVDSGGPACLSPCPPSCSMFCQRRRAAGLMGSPRGCVGATPPHPLPPQLPCPPSPAPLEQPQARCELQEWGGRSGLPALGPLSPAADDVQEPPCAGWRDVWGLTPAQRNRSNPGLSKCKTGLGRRKHIVDFTFP